MRRAVAIVTDYGGPTSHAAIAGRALGKPSIIGTRTATRSLRAGEDVTVWCVRGEPGKVFHGIVSFVAETHELDLSRRSKTGVMVNIGSPAEAEFASGLPCDGIGVTRTEFVIRDVIGVHPMALCEPGRVTDPVERQAIARQTGGERDTQWFFERVLMESIEAIARAFLPREVLIRLTDLKADEYRELLGGRVFEHEERNPMLGFRGAKRYRSDRYQPAFAAECRAIAGARRQRGLTNISVLIPFCRTTREAEAVIDAMRANGLSREDGLTIDMMCEVPSNVVMIDEFSEIFDGFSIGSNDLTQLTLGIDRDSEDLWDDFDERDPSVGKMISTVIRSAKRKGRRVGLCGQAASDYPEFLRFIVEQGIDYVSLNPDSVIETIAQILDIEVQQGLRTDHSPGTA